MLGCGKQAQSPEAGKYALKVPNGLAFSEFKGYENWQLISISQDGPAVAAILGNPEMIKAYEAGIPGNGKPFPDGSKMTKIHWVPSKMATFPAATVPGRQHDVDFMVKDSKRFADSGGWGWAAFEYDSATGKFTPRDHGGQSTAGERRQVRIRLVALMATASTAAAQVEPFPPGFHTQRIATNGTTLFVRVGGAGPGRQARLRLGTSTPR